MKALFARLSPRRAVGVYLGERSLSLSQVAATPLGPVELSRAYVECNEENFAEVLEGLLTANLKKGRGSRRLMAFSLPLRKVFYSTRPLKGTNVEVSSQVLLHEVMQSPNSNIEDMAIDRIDGSPAKRPIVSLASCRKKYLTGLLESMQRCGVRPFRVEPTPCAILRVAERRHRAPRKAKNVVRLFLGHDDALAVLTANGWPLVPRSIVLNEDTAGTIASAVRLFDTLGRLCGTDSAIDTVMIHGRHELCDQVDLEVLEKQLGARIQWHPGPEFEGETIAYGVALGCIQNKAQDFDLARSLKRRESIWEIFPWAELAVQLIVVVGLALFLLNRSQELTTKYAAVRSETMGRHWLNSMNETQLNKERQDLEQKVTAIRKFLTTRVVWSEYTHDLPEKLPEKARLSSFYGVCELEKKGKKDIFKAKKSFIMRIGAPIERDGAVPQEVDDFLATLRGNQLLKRDFPMVDLADIKWYQPFVGSQPTAFFTIVCLPKTITPGTPPSNKSKPH